MYFLLFLSSAVHQPARAPLLVASWLEGRLGYLEPVGCPPKTEARPASARRFRVQRPRSVEGPLCLA